MSLAGAPILLAPNPITHFYPGGGAQSRFRGIEPGRSPSPEDWVGSTTSRFGQSPAGMSRLDDGRLLAEAIESDPVGFLGREHLAAFGPDLCLLVKLLDSSARLIVHAHPDRAFARHHLGTAHGKTEAWIVLSEQPGEVYAGFTRAVAPEELAEWVERQSVEEMLGSLNVLPVSRGDAVLVPAGLPHAIGAGVFVVELQEPTDFSIGLESEGLPVPDLGLGWPLALQAIDRSAWDTDRVRGLHGPGLGGAALAGSGRAFPEPADPFFRAELCRPAPEASIAASGATIGAGPAILVVLEGDGELVFESGRTPIGAGQTLLLPHGCGPVSTVGDAVVLACRPPRPGPLEPARPAL